MKTIDQYNKALKVLDHTILTFSIGVKPTFSIVKLDPEAGFFEKLMKTNITETICTYQDYSLIAKEADSIISQYGSGFVGAK